MPETVSGGEGRADVKTPREGVLTEEAMTAVDEAAAVVKRIKAHGTTSIRAGDILTLLRHHDIPCSIDSFAAQGWTAKLGDPTKGFYAQQGRFRTIDAAANWLLQEARRHYPDAMPGGPGRGETCEDHA